MWSSHEVTQSLSPGRFSCHSCSHMFAFGDLTKEFSTLGGRGGEPEHGLGAEQTPFHAPCPDISEGCWAELLDSPQVGKPSPGVRT